MTKPKVELRPAFEFTCEACGANGFASTRIVPIGSLSFEDREAMEAFLEDIDEHGSKGVVIVAAPETVACSACGSEFEAEEEEIEW